MNRKLHHSLSAFATAAAFLVVGLVSALPGTPPTVATSAVVVKAGRTATNVAVRVYSDSGASARRQRHRIVMPYFSFSSRS